MSTVIEDTYFLDANTALQTALQANEVETSSDNVKGLQVCYYEAEQPLKNAPQNCIFVPLNDVYNYFVTTKNRFPTQINCDNTDFSQEDRELLSLSIHQILTKAKLERAELIDILMKQIKEQKPDFTDEKLRVFVPACRETTVIKNISENIAKTFEKRGYDVCFFIQDNAMQGCVDILPYIHTLYEFNPHIIVNINHFNNEYLNDEVFNFVWFQDIMPILQDENKIKVRKRDYIFHLTDVLRHKLQNKNIESVSQSFCIDSSIYRNRPEIKRRNKIVFIGSSYKSYLPVIKHKKVLLEEMKTCFFNKGQISLHKQRKLSLKYNVKQSIIEGFYRYIIRDILILEFCKLNLDLEIEVYGYGFGSYPELDKYYKGIVEFGEEVSKVYNSAKYCFASGGYILQQRVFEATASGCIPIVYNSNETGETEQSLNEYMVLFKKLSEIPEKIKSNLIKSQDVFMFSKEFTYDHFCQKIINRVNFDL